MAGVGGFLVGRLGGSCLAMDGGEAVGATVRGTSGEEKSAGALGGGGLEWMTIRRFMSRDACGSLLSGWMLTTGMSFDGLDVGIAFRATTTEDMVGRLAG